MKKLLILMLLCLVHIAVMAQNAAIHIKGVVQDPYGDPVTGAVVVVKNTLDWVRPPTLTDSLKLRPTNMMCCK